MRSPRFARATASCYVYIFVEFLLYLVVVSQVKQLHWDSNLAAVRNLFAAGSISKKSIFFTVWNTIR